MRQYKKAKLALQTDWNFITDTIRRRKCVLIIGPQVYTDAEGTPLEEALCRALDARNAKHPYIQSFYENDGFFLFRENKFRSRVISQMRDFYNGPFPQAEAIFEKIAQIPFQVIVSFVPDRLPSKVLTAHRVAHQTTYYHYGQAAKPLEKPVSELPVFFNLLGWVEEDESLVLTHNDLFDYLEAVFTGGRMNTELKAELLQANNYIFLGIPFGKWYMQLLLRVLGIHADGANFDRISPAPDALDPTTRSMYEQQFKIQFVEENIQAFVQELHERCADKGMLRQSPSATPDDATPPTPKLVNTPDEIMNLIAYGDTRNALDSLRVLLSPARSPHPPFRELEMQAVLMMSRFENLERKAQAGVLYTQEDNVERAKITYDLAALINRVREAAMQPA
ncbi:MAG: hypothetical protein KF734_08995 [Saprospiraceae bacterium]|nr:hypothetical protein [Saprospiraceae bacterium]